MAVSAQEFYQSIRGKTVAFCGIGGSNLPLIKIFAQKGALVTARDRRNREQLGETAGELEALGVGLRLGESYLETLDEEIIFRTPGMKYYLPELTAAREQGAAVTSEMEVFFKLCPCKTYAVTGSDGKTTTTSMIAEMFTAAGRRVHLGGNIGKPLLPEIETVAPGDVAVVELSSFQLISMRQSPDVAVVTNLSPNHLDMHKDIDEYINAKKNVYLHQDAFGRTVLNSDNEITAGFAAETRGETCLFSRRKPCVQGAWLREDGMIVHSGPDGHVEVLPANEIKIPGDHNIENYLAAISAVWGDVPLEAIRTVAKTFGGVAHRAELVRELNGVRWYNDSIASSPTRTACGTLSLYENKIILIAGGYDKKIPYGSLGPIICEKVKLLVLMGATAPKIEAAVLGAPNYQPGCPEIVHVANMDEAVALCGLRAVPGDVVSLSPASASFDLYPNFEARGNHFKSLVTHLR